jgi:hypothetical protein
MVHPATPNSLKFNALEPVSNGKIEQFFEGHALELFPI